VKAFSLHGTSGQLLYIECFLLFPSVDGVLRFEDYFSNRVKQLAFTFPENAMTSSGAPFWSAPKRFPRPLEFSSSDPSHLSFLLAASILRAETFGIPIPDWVKDQKKLAEAVDKVMVPDFQPKQGVKIQTDEKATSLSSASVDDAAVIEELIAKLEVISRTLSPGFHMNPVQFEKVSMSSYGLLMFCSIRCQPSAVTCVSMCV
jgi:ubiquitin-activating enzyme E1